MISISGYTTMTQIGESRKHVLYRGYRDTDQRPVVIQVYTTRQASSSDIARFKLEYQKIQAFQSDGVVQVEAVLDVPDGILIVLEDFNGRPLSELFGPNLPDLKTFLTIARQLAMTLADLHRAGIVHQALTPQHVLFQPETGRVKLTGFGVSQLLTRELQAIYEPQTLQEILPYVSPEQTGRMNRQLDYRTDFYSLGVTLYQLLTGRVPFQSQDPLELIHHHIAQNPRPPDALNPHVPSIVSEIVMKLLAKEAEQRYQNAAGLEKDFAACLAQFEQTGRIEDLIVGKQDVLPDLHLPQQLYGREPELALLMAAFERASQGAAELVLVVGPAGIGKTSLVNEIDKSVVRQKGYFISGKFEPFKKDSPYRALIQAFGRLMRSLLAESEARVHTWKAKLLEALGTNGQLVIDVIPEAAWLLGPQPALPAVGPAEARRRFDLTFEKFISVFTQPEHPLVLFLDDLQWADSDSLTVLENLLAAPRARHLLVLGAYRENEVSPPQLLPSVEKIQRAGTTVTRIPMAALNAEVLNQLIADALRCTPDESRLLARLIGDRTENNPLFVKEFLKALRDADVLKLDPSGNWHWDLDGARRLPAADNVIALMAHKIGHLSPRTQGVLKLAACIGSQFDLELLALVYQKPVKEALADLAEALDKNLVFFSAGTYYFFHDRIQEAIYSQISDEARAQTHYKIGTWIRRQTGPEALPERVFFIVDQLNAARPLLRESSEKSELTRLNLLAGQRAKATTAYASAVRYLTAGLELLPQGCWQNDYDLTLALYLDRVECEFILGNYPEAEKLFDLAFRNMRTGLEQAKARHLQATLYHLVLKPGDMLQASVDGLARLGINVPLKLTLPAAILEFLKVRVGLWRRSTADLAALPEMTDPRLQLAMALGEQIAIAAYMVSNLMLNTWITLKMVNTSVRHGNTLSSASAYMSYGILHAFFGSYRTAYEMGQFALALGNTFNNPEAICSTTAPFSIFVNHWREHAARSLDHVDRCLAVSLETGRVLYLVAAATQSVVIRFFTGENLDNVHRDCLKNLERINRFSAAATYLQSIRQVILNLKGLTQHATSLSDAQFDEAAMVPLLMPGKTIDRRYYAYKCFICYLHGDYTEALQMAIEGEKYRDTLRGSLFMPLYVLAYALTLAALYPTASAVEKKRYWKRLKSYRGQLKRWAENCPENFRHLHLLVSAEMARLADQPAQAMTLYEQAIGVAHQYGYANFAAVAAEAAARFYLGLGLMPAAQAYLRQARDDYLKWGASAKVRDLDEQYPQLLVLASTGTSIAALDVITALKASQTLSEEIVLDKLLGKLIRIILESAGAQKACLILEHDDQLFIEAQGRVDKNEIWMLQSTLIETSPDLSPGIVNYVRHTHETLVLDHAGTAGPFTADPYVRRHQPKSILCLPILKQTRLVGLLYLENNLTPYAFTPERVTVLNILAAQAAISLENTRLYNELEMRVQRRTAELEIARQQAEALAKTDALTGIYNRRGMMEVSERELRLATRTGRPLALIAFDLDHFKRINDRYGHGEGDRVLREVVSMVQQTIRATDLFGRIGGEEFLLVLPDTTDQGAIQLAERLRQCLADHVTAGTPPTAVTASFGVTWTTDRHALFDPLLSAADAALYRAKNNGRNRVEASHALPG